MSPPPRPRPARNPLVERLGGYPLAAFQDLVARLAADGRPVHDFSIGDPVEPTPAFIAEAVRAAVPEVSQYPTAAGPRVLREEIARWVGRRLGVEVDPDHHVLPTAGSKEAIFHFPLAIIDPHGSRRGTIWGDPGYPVYGRGTQLAGGVSDPVVLGPADDWRLPLARLAADEPERLRRTAIAWLNHPHNPTGATIDRAGYAQAIAVAREHGIVLGSDECYVEIHPPDASPPPSVLQAADGDLSGIVAAFSLSKRSGMTGYRCGALVGDPELIRMQRLLRPNAGTASPTFIQRAAAVAWADDDHVAERRMIFHAKRHVLEAFFSEVGIVPSGSQATFYLWVPAPGGDDAAYAEALLRHRVVVSPGRAFGEGGRGWLRLALVPDLVGCRAAVASWRDAIDAGSLPGHG